MKKEIIETCEIQGWKGKGDTQIYQGSGYYKILEYRKAKEDGETYTDEHTIPKENVDVLWKLIRTNCELGIEYKYKYIVRKLLEHYKFHEQVGCPLEMFMESFNGGTNRSNFYFPYYYFVIKVLEAKGHIQFLGRGGIIRLSEQIEVI